MEQSFWIRIKLPTGGYVDREYRALNAWFALQFAEQEFGVGNCDIVNNPIKGVDNRS